MYTREISYDPSIAESVKVGDLIWIKKEQDFNTVLGQLVNSHMALVTKIVDFGMGNGTWGLHVICEVNGEKGEYGIYSDDVVDCYTFHVTHKRIRDAVRKIELYWKVRQIRKKHAIKLITDVCFEYINNPDHPFRQKWMVNKAVQYNLKL
jgi:hypothetical protein